MRKIYLFYIAVPLLLASCSATNLMTLRVTEPAPIYVPSEGKAVGILNRSEPSKENKVTDEIDKILSLEGKNMDAEAAQKTVFGLQEELTKNNGFTKVILIEDNSLKNSGMSVFPAPIAWETVEKMARKNQIDYVFELSYFDTDTKVDYKTNTIQNNSIGGIKIPLIEHQATIQTLIKNGWRIYDVKNKTILSELNHSDGVTSVGRGINPMKAVEAVMGRKENVLALSGKIGQDYALQTLPYNIRVSRDYYVSGTANFETAKRRAQTGDWDGAAELWNKETNNLDPKIAGRACYNMAISNEINGDLDKAISWASKAYTDYGDKLALRYVNILKNRKSKNQQLQRESN